MQGVAHVAGAYGIWGNMGHMAGRVQAARRRQQAVDQKAHARWQARPMFCDNLHHDDYRTTQQAASLRQPDTPLHDDWRKASGRREAKA